MHFLFFSGDSFSVKTHPNHKTDRGVWAVKKFRILLFLLMILFFSGCRVKPERIIVPSRIVTAIDIYCQNPSGNLHRHYESPGKVEAVLHYVRQLTPNGPVNIPEEAMGETCYKIVIHSDDGGLRIHRQRSNTYAALHRRYWGRISPSLGLRLGHLMALLPSDPVDANRIDIT